MNVGKVSIVISCYNGPDVVVAVKSAHSQTFAHKEIIVVNDGSNKETEIAINSVSDYIDILIKQSNHGQSIARNNGIKKATGEYILNLDSDDFFEPSFCEKALIEFKKDPSVKIVTCKAQRFRKESKIDVFTPLGGGFENFLFSNSALGSSMFKKIDWVNRGGYEENLPILGFEDWEFYLNILQSGGLAKVIPEVLFHYQVRENSTTARIKHQRLQKFKLILLKHSELYKDNFEMLIDHLIGKIEKEEFQIMKKETSLDFRLGKTLLQPFRLFKSLKK